MTKFKKLILEKYGSVVNFAQNFGVDKTTAWAWLRKDYYPSKNHARKLIKTFNGELTYNDIYD